MSSVFSPRPASPTIVGGPPSMRRLSAAIPARRVRSRTARAVSSIALFWAETVGRRTRSFSSSMYSRSRARTYASKASKEVTRLGYLRSPRRTLTAMEADVIVVGAGLSGLVAATEVADAGKRVILLEQEPKASLGGQAFWSFGGLFFVDSPEQRRLGIKDSRDLALQDWLGSAGFDRLDDEDKWARQWAEAYVDFAAGKKRPWLHAQ